MNKIIGFRVSETEFERLKKFSVSEERTMSSVIRYILKKQLGWKDENE